MKSEGRDPTVHETVNLDKVVNCLAFHKDMKYLAIGGTDSVLNIWNLASKKSIVYRDHTAEILSLAYSNNTPLLASASMDQSIRIWNYSNDRKSKLIKGHHGPVRSVEFSQDGEFLVSGSDDKSVKLWDVGTLKFRASYLGHKNWVRTVRFSPDSSLIVSGGEDAKIILWETEKKKALCQYNDHEKKINDVKLSQDNVVSCSDDATIQFHDLRSSKLVQLYNSHGASVRQVSLFQKYMVSVADDAEIRIWDTRKGLPLYTLYSHKGPIRCCAVSRLGNYFATGGEDKKVAIWNSGFPGAGIEQIKYFDMCKTGHRADPRTMSNSEDYQRIQGLRQACELRKSEKQLKRVHPQEERLQQLNTKLGTMKNMVTSLECKFQKREVPGRGVYDQQE